MGVTVIVALPDFPERCAVMTADPAAIPLTSPVDETVAMVLSLELHVTLLRSRRPCQFRTVACARVVSPTAMDAAPRETVTDAIRTASAPRSSVLSESVPVTLSPEHENMPIIAKAATAPRFIVRFTVNPMNRATAFSQVAHQGVTRGRFKNARDVRWCLQPATPSGRRAIYVRQAKRSYRHSSER
jgi:hypothetical protein